MNETNFTDKPTIVPSYIPTHFPSIQPTNIPTFKPTFELTGKRFCVELEIESDIHYNDISWTKLVVNQQKLQVIGI